MIQLDREPAFRDFEFVRLAAIRPCECTPEMEKELKHGDELICKPCAVRQVLNGLTSLAERL